MAGSNELTERERERETLWVSMSFVNPIRYRERERTNKINGCFDSHTLPRQSANYAAKCTRGYGAHYKNANLGDPNDVCQ